MSDSFRTYAHFIEEATGNTVARILILHIPRIGDEIRFSADKYYKVTCVVWVYDEQDHPYARVNIGMENSND